MLDVMQEAELIRRVTKKVYWNSRYIRLRTQIDEEDLVQMVFLKLLHRDNYKKYSDKYPKAGFIYRVANGCAISFANKRSNIREWTILDQPRDNDEDSRTILDSLVSDTPHIDFDTRARINRISASMDPSVNKSVVIRYNDEDIPFSIDALFDFFIDTQLSKKEISSYVINLKTNSPVSQTTFDKWWKSLERTVKTELSRF